MPVHEPIPEPSNPLGLDGIEFIEYATSQPQAFGTLLQKIGSRRRAAPFGARWCCTARADESDRQRAPDALPDCPLQGAPLRWRRSRCGARRAYRVSACARPRRLGRCHAGFRHGVKFRDHGVGDSLIYFVDRYGDFSIYDVISFRWPAPIPPPAIAGCTTSRGSSHPRRPDRRWWTSIKACSVLGAAEGQYFGILPKGHAAREPLPQVLSAADRAAARTEEIRWDEALVRLGLGHARSGGHARPAGARHRVRRHGAVQPSRKAR